MIDPTEKEVRDFLRTADVLIARLQTAKPLTRADMTMLETYVARIKSILLTLKSYSNIEISRDIQDRSSQEK